MSARLIRRLRAARADGDAGITLMELLVSMALSTIIGAMTLGLVVNINTSSADTTDRSINSSSARNAIQAWTAYLRVADSTTAGLRPTNRIEWLTPNDMLFYADLGNRLSSTDTQLAQTLPPTMIWLRLDSKGALVEEQFASTAAAGAAAKVCRTLATGVSAPTALFTAGDRSGTAMTGLGTAPTASAGCQKLPVTPPSQTSHPDPTVQSNLQKVYSVTIDFVVRDTRKAHPLEFFSQAILPAMGSV